MSGTASLLRRYWPELVWSVWLVINTLAVAFTPAETIPYHNIWLSLGIIYGFRVWPMRKALIMVTFIAIESGIALFYASLPEHRLDELGEIPMMSFIFLIMVWFVTRHRLATEQLARSSERERDFVRDASHQLRTPITVARGHAELLRESHDPEVAADAEIVLGEMERLSRISDRLLVLAAAQDRQLVAMAPMSLGELLRDAARRWEPAVERAWRLRIDTEGTIVADAHELEAALDALIENAIKATGEDDHIEMRLRAESDVAVIEVSDTGVGIDPRNLGRVFDRFWRARHGNGTGGGTGLGRSMVRAIAEAHGGSAEAALRPHGGTTFRMRLPGFARVRDMQPA